ncbi:MAG: AAA family ATPase [Deltaproteobacteria bacterium]|nr:AAA family ATPase [Deltaproteobacteria bacterium]
MADQLELKSIELKGFTSIDAEGQTIELRPITVMLGANGAGKSNLVSFFKMLNYMTTGALQQYVADRGFADSLLYFGAKITSEVSARLRFEDAQARDEYAFVLGRDATGRLFLKDETIVYHAARRVTPQTVKLGGGVRESQLKEFADKGDQTCQVVYNLLSQCQVFQFHDTSATAKIRSEGYIDDSRFLRSDGGNLAAFLCGLMKKNSGKRYYDRIVRHIQLIVPQFEDFDLAPSTENENYVRLNWREKGSDYLFGPHQLSDGSLRFMALTTLFMQPPELRPKVIIVDEPELGLHPAAISALAGMVKAVTPATQVILATQSSRLVDEFTADQVMIVERDENRRRTIFRWLKEQDLAEWLERYCLSELWEKNVLGGRP